jgi:excinuclease ABC subunit C
MIPIANLPQKPGCYLYKDAQEHIIYIGKAKNIRKRVAQYFQKKNHDDKTRVLVQHIADMDYIITSNEIEALLLENTLIKKHQPKYNIDLKDAKQFAYLEITAETFPRLQLLREKKEGMGELFGPFVSGAAREEISHFLINTFKIRTCKKLPKKSCLRYHLGLCGAPCIQAISQEAYLQDIEKARLILKGKTQDAKKQLEKEMKLFAAQERYESANTAKKQLASLEWLTEKQNAERKKQHDEDIINYHEEQGTVYIMKFSSAKGTLHDKQSYVFVDKIEWYEDFLQTLYEEEQVPKELILPKNISPVLKQFLEQQRGNKVIITIPKQGEKKSLLSLVKENIMHEHFGGIKQLEDLKEKLNLDIPPRIIECFDISHLAGTHTVASMVQFKDGKPNKKNYRRFKIRTVAGIDDFASMHEVIHRRYKRIQEEEGTNPDLIVIDGGKGQLSSAVAALQELGVQIPIIALAKRIEEIFLPGQEEPILLSSKSKGLLLLRSIRDEAHRFAITYNRLLRKKELTQ